MIDLLIVAGIPLGYLLLGALLARTQAVRVYRWRWERNVSEWSESTARREAAGEARLTLVAIALLWPLALVVLLFVGLSSFVIAPVHQRKERAAKLRADADFWATEARSEKDPEKRTMARELAKSLQEQAEAVDLK